MAALFSNKRLTLMNLYIYFFLLLANVSTGRQFDED
jgi:hypothetical protein